jgi:enhancing lycopene biosynthesis protein 2
MNKPYRFAVVLSGCGRADGSEIYETVSALYAVAASKNVYQCFAPNIMQTKTIDLYHRSETSEKRNVLSEAARLARGNILDLKQFKPQDYDAIIFPGGMGAVTNWCDYASKGLACEINPEIKRVIKESYNNHLVICAMCIAPTLLALVLADKKIRFTLGADSVNTRELETLGANHKETSATGVCVDEKNRICTTPAYMLATNITEIFAGAEKMIASAIKILENS